MPGYFHSEVHKVHRIGWLRAAVLGANDGIVSTASLIIGVAAANTSRQAVLISGLAGLVAGAFSMAAGEYVSVYSQADAEKRDFEREKAELSADPEGELMELAGIYIKRGLSPELASEVARQLTNRDPLEAHLRDELGITEPYRANPVQAALFSAVSFALGSALPLLIAVLGNFDNLLILVAAGSGVSLAILGAAAAHTAGASVFWGTVRVVVWGSLAMAVTALVGRLFGVAVG
ncbi:MAG TPA: VIT family protein [Pyrinomonadaceae bacterium]|nr:VIT family protein [Pyrinomonadaceae bacterium]